MSSSKFGSTCRWPIHLGSNAVNSDGPVRQVHAERSGFGPGTILCVSHFKFRSLSRALLPLISSLGRMLGIKDFVCVVVMSIV